LTNKKSRGAEEKSLVVAANPNVLAKRLARYVLES